MLPFAADRSLTQAVLETDSETMSQSDLLQFQEKITKQKPKPAIVAGITETNGCTLDNCGEGNLDIQYIMGIAQGPNTTFFYDEYSDGIVNLGDEWVNALIYIQDMPASMRPSVVSISWGSYEYAYYSNQLDTFNNEAMKLGLMGVTIIASSGDDGAAGEDSRACTASSSSLTLGTIGVNKWNGTNTWTGEGYFAQFPASSPYVVSVGKLPTI